jgi:hypothetical protein
LLITESNDAGTRVSCTVRWVTISVRANPKNNGSIGSIVVS